MSDTYKATERACYTGYITQAIGINYIPLLYLFFTKEYGVSFSQIAFLSGMMFVIQLIVDIISAKLVDKIGYRSCAVGAHILAAAGIGGLGFLPELVQDSFLGVLICVAVFAAGCGLIEVIISPIVAGCPRENKAASMGILHSFYCWGQAGVVLVSTLVFAVFGIESRRVMALVWAMVPAVNAFVFAGVPIAPVVAEGEGMTVRELFVERVFWCAVVLMICAGASELAVSQWASAFAEAALGVNKNIGDIAGPCAFAVLMGISRVLFSAYSQKKDSRGYMLFSSVLCVIGYMLTAAQPNAVISLIGCAVVGFAVGAMWPGSLYVASDSIPSGGTAMFALMALAGDIGCSTGTSAVGNLSQLFGNNLKAGIMFAAVFPVIMTVLLIATGKKHNSRKSKEEIAV